MTKSLFPEQHIKDYLAQHLLPDELSEMRVKAHCVSLNKLINYNHNILLFLESNAIYDNMFTLQGPAFEALFKRYTHYYAELASIPHILELLRTEQAIYFITDLSPATQDISSYLKIVEHLCDKEEICELILLLSKKHSTWCEGYSEQYEKWLHFLIPFFQYAQSVMFEGDRVLTLRDVGTRSSSSLLYEMIKRTVSHLKSLLSGEAVMKKILEELDEERLGDVEYVLEEVLKLKNVMVKDRQDRDDEFYYKLGVLSFLIQLLKFNASQENGLLHSCTLMTLYTDIFAEFKKISTANVHRLAHIRESRLDAAWWRAPLKQLCGLLRQEDQPALTQAAHVQSLQMLLYFMDVRTKDVKNPYALSDRRVDPLIIETLDVLFESHELYGYSQTFSSGDSLDNRENNAWDILLLVKAILTHIDNDQYNLKIIYGKLLDIVRNKHLRPLLQDKCFSALRQLRKVKDQDRVPNHLNLLEISFKNIIESKTSSTIDKLAMNVKHSTKLLYSTFNETTPFGTSQEDELFEIYKLFIAKVKKPKHIRYAKQDINMFKYLGIFLTYMLFHDYAKVQDIRLEFLSIFTNFLVIQCKLDCWDIYLLQADFWTRMQATKNFARLASKKSIMSLQSVIERQAVKSQFEGETFDRKFPWKTKGHQLRRQIRNVICNSLDDIEKGFQRHYDGLEWITGKCDQKQQDMIYSIKLVNRKFTYFTIPRIECLAREKRSEMVNYIEGRATIFERIIKLYFHPAFWIFSEKTELDISKKCFETICKSSKPAVWYLFQAFYKNAVEFLRDINESLHSKPETAKRFFSVCQLEGFHPSKIKDYSPILIELSKQDLLFYSFLKRLPNFCTLIEFRNADTYSSRLSKQQKVSFEQNFKLTLELLLELAINLIKSTDKLDDSEKQNEQIVQMINYIIDGIKHLILTLQRPQKVQDIAGKVLLDKFSNYCEISYKKGAQYLLKIFTNPAVIGLKPQNLSFRQVICRKEIWGFAIQRIRELIPIKEIKSREYFSKLDAVKDLTAALAERFRSKGDINQTRKATCHTNTKKQKNREFIPNMFFELDKALDDFPVFELLLKGDSELTSSFQTLMTSFEGLYVYISDKYLESKKSNSVRKRSNPSELEKVEKSLDELKDSVTIKFNEKVKLMSAIYSFGLVSENEVKPLKLIAVQKLQESFLTEGKLYAMDPTLDIQCDQMLRLQTYSQLILDWFSHFPAREDIKALIEEKSKRLIEGFVAMEWEQIEQTVKIESFLPRLQNMMTSVSKAILNQWIEQCEKHDCLEVLSVRTRDYVNLALNAHEFVQKHSNFDILGCKSGLLDNITKLIHLEILFNTRQDSSYRSIFKTMLSLEKKESWEMSTTFSIGLMLDNFMNSALPESVQIQTNVKRILISSENWPNPLKLTDLYKHNYIKDKEQTHIQSLVDVLTSEFRIYSSSEDMKPENSFSVDKLFIALDVSQEVSDPVSIIESVLQSLSKNARAVINLLMETLIENFLANITSFVDSESKAKFKDTSNVLLILSLLLRKYPHLAGYIAFQKHNYNLLFEKYITKMVDFDSGNTLNSVTFLECLFQINYFSYNYGDFPTILFDLISPTGITFSSSDGAHSVLDISSIITSKILDLIIQEFKKSCQKKANSFADSTERYIGLQSSINLFNFIWYQARQIYNNDTFNKCFKDMFLKSLREILCHFPKMISEYSEYPRIHDSLVDSLPDHLQYYYDKESAAVSLEEVKQFKYDNYEQFLGGYQSTEDFKRLNSVCDNVNDNAHTYNTVLPFANLESTIEDLDMQSTLVDIKDKNDGKSWTKLRTLTFIRIGKFYSFQKSWRDARWDMNSKITDFCSNILVQSYNDETEKNYSESLLKYLNWNNTNISDSLSLSLGLSEILHPKCAKELDRINQAMFEPTTSDLKSKKFYDIISENLKSKDCTKEQPKEEIIYDKNVPNQDNTPAVKISKKVKEENGLSESRVKYFKYLELEGKGEFEFLQRQALIRLKVLSEKMLVESLCLSHNKEDVSALVKVTVNTEISEQLKKSSEFEKNLLLCLIEQFEVLSCFDYPVEFSEIKEEYTWILSNFTNYLNVLNHFRTSVRNYSNLQYALEINSELVFHKEITFCIDHPISVLQKTKTTGKVPDSVLNFVTNMFITDDNVVESVISSFYIVVDDSTTSKHQQILSKFCNSALFEAKLIDYCFFFLYSPDHIDMTDQQMSEFPYKAAAVSNLDESWINNTYNIVARNILYFLNDILRNKEYLLYQPRLYLEQHGLDSLRQLKASTQFYEQTARMISISDLLIGLLDLSEIKTDASLYNILQSLITHIFSAHRRFTVIEAKTGDEMIETKKVATLESGKRLMRMENFKSIFESLVDFIPYELTVVLQSTLKLHLVLNQAFKDIGAEIREAARCTGELKYMTKFDITRVTKYESELAEFEKFMSILSFLMSLWALEVNEFDDWEQENRDSLLRKNYKMIHYQILENKELTDLMIDIYWITRCLPMSHEAKNSKLKSTLSHLTRICIYYFALVCVQYEITQPSVHVNIKSEGKINKFDDILVEDSYKLREKQNQLEDLFTKMYNSNKNLAQELLSEDLGSDGALIKSIQMISGRLYWFQLNLDLKKKSLINNIDKDLKETGSGGTRSLVIQRRNLVKSTINAFASKPSKTLRQKIGVRFENENGIDAGGLTREWVTIINRELFNPQTGLFQLTEDNVSLQPSPLARAIPSHLKYLQLAGMVLAKAIQQECVVDVTLSDSLLKHILRRRVTLNDLKGIDLCLTRSLDWMLNNPIEDLDQYFTYEAESFGKRTIRELIPDGFNTLVTEANKREFVSKVCEVKMKEDIKEEIEAFLQGFYLIIPPHFLRGFTPSELQMLISGPSEINVNEMKASATYSTYSENSEVMKWMWEVLFSFSQTELSAFVLFVSGSPKIPYGGLKNRPFRFQRSNKGPDSLPKSHTCFWSIEVPLYRSKEELKKKLLLAIFEGQGSFAFG